MPVAGGLVPPTGAMYTELQAITRRAVVPRVIVQFGQATPYLSASLSNAQTAAGGISSVTVPVQGASMTTAQMSDFGGGFTAPTEQNGLQNAEYNLKVALVPISYNGMEGLLQDDAAIVPRIEVKMNDAGNGLATMLASQVWTNATNGTNDLDGLPLIVATGRTYGNINSAAAGNTFWDRNTMAPAGGVDPTRQRMLVAIMSATNANFGEKPTMGFCSPATWALLAQGFQGQEQYVITPERSFDQVAMGARSGFDALKVNGVPIYIEPGCTNGDVWFIHTRYTSFFVHRMASFIFSGFASTIPNNVIGYTGVVIAGLEHVCVKPRAVTFQPGYNFSTL